VSPVESRAIHRFTDSVSGIVSVSSKWRLMSASSAKVAVLNAAMIHTYSAIVIVEPAVNKSRASFLGLRFRLMINYAARKVRWQAYEYEHALTDSIISVEEMVIRRVETPSVERHVR